MATEITISPVRLASLLEAAFDRGAKFEVWRKLSPGKSYAESRREFIEHVLKEVGGSG